MHKKTIINLIGFQCFGSEVIRLFLSIGVWRAEMIAQERGNIEKRLTVIVASII